MAGWRTADQEPVASRHAIARGMDALVDAIEQLSRDGARPAVTACWQDEAYLDVPPGLLDRLATVADLTIACVGRPRLSRDADHVQVEPGEEIAEEWSIVAVTATGGVALVAHEVEASLPALTVEGGRTFRYDATDEPRAVVAHARRLLRLFGARMQPDAAARLASATTGFSSGAQVGEHVDALCGAVEAAIAAADDRRREDASLPSDTGGLAGLADWLADAGPRAPSLGMIVVRCDARGMTTQLREHAARIGRVGDIIVDVPPDAAMMVAPGLHGDALEACADEICGLLAESVGTGDVDAVTVDVPAEHARRDLVGSLGTALVELRQRQVANAPTGG